MTTLIADEVYADLEPITAGDAQRGYPLRALNRAIGSMFAQAEEAIRAQGGLDSWERIWNPDLTPAWLLPFAGQAVGVAVDTSLSVQAQREQIKEEGPWKRGRLASMIALMQATLGHANFVRNPSFEYDALATTPALWGQNGYTEAGGTIAASEAVAAQAGKVVALVKGDGVKVSEGASILLPGTYKKGIAYNVSVYAVGAAGGEEAALVVGSIGTPADQAVATSVLEGPGKWKRLSATWTPTADRTDAVFCVRLVKAVAASFYIDAAQVETGLGLTAYFDGDSVGYAWSGIKGQSAAYKLNDFRRVRVVERNTTAWTLLMITSPGETPNPTLTNIVGQLNKPGGIVLTVEQSDLPLIDEGTKTIDASTGIIDTAKLSDIT